MSRRGEIVVECGSPDCHAEQAFGAKDLQDGLMQIALDDAGWGLSGLGLDTCPLCEREIQSSDRCGKCLRKRVNGATCAECYDGEWDVPSGTQTGPPAFLQHTDEY